MRPGVLVRCKNWVIGALGEGILHSKRERALRFVEEAIELGQACGLELSEVGGVAARVYSRPSGDVRQEAAGAYFTLGVLSWAHGFVLDDELEKELRRVEDPDLIRAIRAKHADKVALGIGEPLDERRDFGADKFKRFDIP